MKRRVVAYTMAGLLGLVVGGASWSCGCTRTVCTAKPVCHTVQTVEVVKARPTCGCGGFLGGGGGGNFLFW